MYSFIIGLILSCIIALIAYKKKSLDLTGFIMAILMGTLIYYFGSYIIFSLLMLFFISSSLISKFDKIKTDDSNRNFIQVFANSFVALFFSILFYVTKNEIYLVLAAMGIAATTSDTWASEIGKFSKGKTISIITFKKINKGESGGISLLGSIAALLGSTIIALVFLLLRSLSKLELNNIYIYVMLIIMGGFLGNIIDSILGIILQEKYYDSSSDNKIEKVNNRKEHKKISGLMYVNNDVVNILSSVIITVVFWLFVFL